MPAPGDGVLLVLGAHLYTEDRNHPQVAVGHSISVLIGVSEKATCAQTETFKHSGLKRDDAQRCSSALIINRAVD